MKTVIFYLGDQQFIYQVVKCEIHETAGGQSYRMSPQAREDYWGNSFPPMR